VDGPAGGRGAVHRGRGPRHHTRRGRPSTSVDGVFTLHELGTPPARPPRPGARCWSKGSSAPATAPSPPSRRPWPTCSTRGPSSRGRKPPGPRLGGPRPGGHRRTRQPRRPDRRGPPRPAVPVTLLALGSDPRSLGFPHFRPLFDRADSVLAVTETERGLIADHHGHPTACTGSARPWPPTPVPAPNPTPGGSDRVRAGADRGAEDATTRRTSWPAWCACASRPAGGRGPHRRLLRLAPRPGDPGWAIERTSDLDRLMAWPA